MPFLKSLALSLLSLLLFLSLSLFGLAFMLNNTLLNPEFVTAELDRLAVSSLAGELISVQAPGGESTEKITAALIKTISAVEPGIKKQVGAATDSIYDYLLGKSQGLNLARTLKNTILSSDFIGSVVNELDISSLAGEYVRKQMAGNIPADAGYLAESIDKHLDEVITELEPWLKGQITMAADPIVDYLLGESRSFSIVIPLEPVKTSLRAKLWQTVLATPPPELAALPQAMWEPYFDQSYEEFAQEIPATFTLNQGLLGTKLPDQLATALAEAEQALAQAKQYVGYFQLGYRGLIGFMALLILSIILLNRRVKDATRSLGITFLTYGAFEYAGIFVAKYLSRTELSLPGIPPSLQTWLPQFLDNLLAPLATLSLGLLIAGAVLIIFSILYKSRQA